MYKILVLCDSGVSSNKFIDLMRDSARKFSFECEIKPGAISEFYELSKEIDLILLSPQVRYNLAKIKKMLPNIETGVISVDDFGFLKTDKLMESIIKKNN